MSRTQDRKTAIKTILENKSYTNTDVVDFVYPDGSWEIDRQKKDVIRGNSVITVKYKKDQYDPDRETSETVITYFERPEFLIEIYSKYRNTNEANDIELLHDSVTDDMHENGYQIIHRNIKSVAHERQFYKSEITVRQMFKYPEG